MRISGEALMRILHVSSEHPPQKVFGLGRYVCDLSRELVCQGHEVHVLTNSVGSDVQDVEDRGVRIHRVDYPPPPKPPGTLSSVLAFNLHLQQRAHSLGKDRLGNPEVVVSHDWLTAGAGDRRGARLCWSHAIARAQPPEGEGSVAQKAYPHITMVRVVV